MREFIDKKDVFGEVKMWNDTGIRNHAVGVLVEAKSDENFYRKFIIENAVFFIGDGWGNVEKAIQAVNHFKIKGVLGIIDADFKRIEKKEIQANLYLTNFHDKEMMLLNSAAWKSVLIQFSNNSISSKTGSSKLQEFENSANKSVLKAILNAAKQIADIRLLNERNNFILKFKEKKTKKGKTTFDYIKYEDFINKKTLQVDNEKLQKAVENKSQKLGFFNDVKIQNKLKVIQNETYDLMEICNGHDVVNIFLFALQEAIGSEKNKKDADRITAERIEESLTIAYRFEDFKTTNLYQDLKNWESENMPYQLFAN